MLKSITDSLSREGHRVITCLDRELAPFLPFLKVEAKQAPGGQELRRMVRSLLREVDASLIIAPESGGTLEGLLHLVEDVSNLSLNSAPDAVAAVSDKYRLYNKLKSAGLRTPETIQLEESDWIQSLRELPYPLILKPVKSAGCASVMLVRNEREATSAVAEFLKDKTAMPILAQRFLRGANMSVSILVSRKGTCVPLTLNQQFVSTAPYPEAFRYGGGTVPVGSPMQDEAFHTAASTIGLFRGLCGYIGVDMVFVDGRAHVVEVNPRLTTSYVGIDKISPSSGEAILKAGMGEQFGRPRLNGYAYFSKVECASSRFGAEQIPEWLACPPTPRGEAMIVTTGNTPDEAALKFQQIKRDFP